MSKREQSERLQAISIRTILPNAVTLMAFMSGLAAIRFGLAEKWELAVAAIIAAGIFDGLDGTVARLLNSASRFGAELDSLSDVVAFGVAPAILLYLWGLQDLDRLGWAVAMIYAIAMALRLARFNASLDNEDEPRARLGFLTGIPAPMGAGLMISPIILDFVLGGDKVMANGMYVSIYAIFVALLMVSTLPTYSLKSLRIKRQWFIPFMLFLAVVVAGLFARTWLVLIFIAVLYLVSIPFSVLSFKKRMKELSDRRNNTGA